MLNRIRTLSQQCNFFLSQGSWAGLHIPASLVLLHIDNTWVYPESEWFTHQRMVASTPFPLNCMRWRTSHLATRRTLAALPTPIHVLQRIHLNCPVLAIPLSKGCSLSAESAGRTSWHGHHYRGLPFMDVARIELSTAVPVLRLHVPGVQCIRFV